LKEAFLFLIFVCHVTHFIPVDEKEQKKKKKKSQRALCPIFHPGIHHYINVHPCVGSFSSFFSSSFLFSLFYLAI